MGRQVKVSNPGKKHHKYYLLGEIGPLSRLLIRSPHAQRTTRIHKERNHQGIVMKAPWSRFDRQYRISVSPPAPK